MLKEQGRELSLYRTIALSLNPYFNGTCSKRKHYEAVINKERGVLILILMEHAQRVMQEKPLYTSWKVLILILMEHAQRGTGDRR